MKGILAVKRCVIIGGEFSNKSEVIRHKHQNEEGREKGKLMINQPKTKHDGNGCDGDGENALVTAPDRVATRRVFIVAVRKRSLDWYIFSVWSLLRPNNLRVSMPRIESRK